MPWYPRHNLMLKNSEAAHEGSNSCPNTPHFRIVVPYLVGYSRQFLSILRQQQLLLSLHPHHIPYRVSTSLHIPGGTPSAQRTSNSPNHVSRLGERGRATGALLVQMLRVQVAQPTLKHQVTRLQDRLITPAMWSYTATTKTYVSETICKIFAGCSIHVGFVHECYAHTSLTPKVALNNSFLFWICSNTVLKG